MLSREDEREMHEAIFQRTLGYKQLQGVMDWQVLKSVSKFLKNVFCAVVFSGKIIRHTPTEPKPLSKITKFNFCRREEICSKFAVSIQLSNFHNFD